MHSSRMRTARFSGRLGGGGILSPIDRNNLLPALCARKNFNVIVTARNSSRRKVMFLQVSVCPGGGCLHPDGVCIQVRSASGSAGICIQGVGGWADPLPDTTGYGQQAGGKHPTGMHYCLTDKFPHYYLYASSFRRNISI